MLLINQIADKKCIDPSVDYHFILGLQKLNPFTEASDDTVRTSIL